jgi:hypothetical protein
MATKPTIATLTEKVTELEARLAEVPDFEAQIAALEARLAEAPAAEKPKNVIEAMLAVMREVTVLGKHERNTTPGQNYNFRGIDATVNALGPAMRKHGLVGIPTLLKVERRGVQTSQGKAQQASEVEVEYRFYGPGGVQDTVSAIVPGESWDSGDKGVSKAMSVAMRIALLQSFALPTDERDPDADTYERAHNIDPRALAAEIEAALAEEDPEAALMRVGDSYGADVLTLVELPHPDGGPEKITAVELIRGHLAQIRSAPKPAPAEVVQAFAAARELEDPAEVIEALRGIYRLFPGAKAVLESTTMVYDGQPVIVAEIIARIVADAEAMIAARGEAPAPAQEPAQSAPTQPEGARAAAEQTARDTTREGDPILEQLRDEIAGQAAVLGIPFEAHAASLLAVQQGATDPSTIPVPVIHQWVSDQRPRVVEALRGQGRATEAATYEAQAPMALGTFDTLTGASARGEEQVRETQDA